MKMTPARAHAYMAFLAVAAIWGVASVVIKATLTHLPPYAFLYFRFLILLPVTIPWYYWYLKRNPIKWEELVPLTVFSLMSTTVFLSLVFLGFERTTAIDGNLLTTVAPIFIVLLGVLFLKEKLPKREQFGIGLVVIGVLVTVAKPLFAGEAFHNTNLVGNIIILCASITWAFFVFLSKKNFGHFSPLHITLHGSIVAFPTFAILAFLEGDLGLPAFGTFIANTPALIGVVYMSFVSYIVAYLLYEFGMSKIEISEGSLFTYLQPLFATPIAVIFLGETITTPFIIGALIIAAGVAISEWR